MSTRFDLFQHTPVVSSFAANVVIFTEGDTFDTAYVVKEGKVDIFIQGEQICTLSEGEIFGEMALINGNVRSATAIAQTDAKLVPISAHQFNFMVDNNRYFAHKVMQVLSQRLFNTNQG